MGIHTHGTQTKTSLSLKRFGDDGHHTTAILLQCVLLFQKVDDKTIVMVVDKGDDESKTGGEPDPLNRFKA